ncbi:hypothetical protein JK358_32960 [Nocardia sp. 2]|uniref:NACHT domain-containing protein n=1 Tax=Nocardia acididurans TaxID=2802282 RepID=A0ABS1MF08_9NOCA|nr:hypothetical protein [Nocardia acididurans]MBL1079227.1 hypothetical protein [Nocardia acididurans]
MDPQVFGRVLAPFVHSGVSRLWQAVRPDVSVPALEAHQRELAAAVQRRERDNLKRLAGTARECPGIRYGTWPPGPRAESGSLTGIRDFYTRRCPTGRMVVLGGPGSGKSLTAIRLLLDLLEQRAEHDPVPVRVNAATWNPAIRGFTGWLAERLARDYDLPVRVAAELVDSGRVVPILDRLDSMHIPGGELVGAWLALEHLNELQDMRVVILCDTAVYERLCAPHSPYRGLCAATRIELRPLTARAITDHLLAAAAQQGGPPGTWGGWTTAPHPAPASTGPGPLPNEAAAAHAPVNGSAGAHAPVNGSAGAHAPVNGSAAAHAPVNGSAGAHAPVNGSAGAHALANGSAAGRPRAGASAGDGASESRSIPAHATGNGPVRARWSPVTTRLAYEPDGVLARTLNTPARLHLAEMYLGRGCSHAAAKLAAAESADEILRLLHSAAIPAAVASTPRDHFGDRPYTQEQAHLWLRTLALHTDRRRRRGRVDAGTSLDDLWELAGRRCRILHGLLVLVAGLVLLGYVNGLLAPEFHCASDDSPVSVAGPGTVAAPAEYPLIRLPGEWHCTAPLFRLDLIMILLALIGGAVAAFRSVSRESSPALTMASRFGATALFSGLAAAFEVDLATWNARGSERALELAVLLGVSSIVAGVVAYRSWRATMSRAMEQATRLAAAGFVAGSVVAVAGAAKIMALHPRPTLEDHLHALVREGVVGTVAIWPVAALLAGLVALSGPLLMSKRLDPVADERRPAPIGPRGWLLLLTAALCFGGYHIWEELFSARASVRFALFTGLAALVVLAGGATCARRLRYLCARLLFRCGVPFAPAPADFLDWAHRHGLLRVTGAAYQFRDHTFRHWLRAHDSPEIHPTPAEPAPDLPATG